MKKTKTYFKLALFFGLLCMVSFCVELNLKAEEPTILAYIAIISGLFISIFIILSIINA